HEQHPDDGYRNGDRQADGAEEPERQDEQHQDRRRERRPEDHCRNPHASGDVVDRVASSDAGRERGAEDPEGQRSDDDRLAGPIVPECRQAEPERRANDSAEDRVGNGSSGASQRDDLGHHRSCGPAIAQATWMTTNQMNRTRKRWRTPRRSKGAGTVRRTNTAGGTRRMRDSQTTPTATVIGSTMYETPRPKVKASSEMGTDPHAGCSQIQGASNGPRTISASPSGGARTANVPAASKAPDEPASRAIGARCRPATKATGMPRPQTAAPT